MSHNNIINIKNPLNIKVNGCHSMELYREIASVFEIEDKDEVQEKKEMLNAYLPTGNGFDNGSKVNYVISLLFERWKIYGTKNHKRVNSFCSQS